MKTYMETSLRNFDFWSGATYTAEHLTNKELDIIESALKELYPDGCDETTVNDIFWFERDFIAECLGYRDWEELEENGEA